MPNEVKYINASKKVLKIPFAFMFNITRFANTVVDVMFFSLNGRQVVFLLFFGIDHSCQMVCVSTYFAVSMSSMLLVLGLLSLVSLLNFVNSRAKVLTGYA